MGKEEEQDGMSVHSPCKAPPSSASSLSKEQSQAELELRFLEALEIYPPGKLKGMSGNDCGAWGACELLPIHSDSSLIDRFQKGIHRNFVLFGVMEFLRRSFDRPFSSEEVMRLLDRFYNLEMLRGDDEDAEIPHREEDFSLPQSYFTKEES